MTNAAHLPSGSAGRTTFGALDLNEGNDATRDILPGKARKKGKMYKWFASRQDHARAVYAAVCTFAILVIGLIDYSADYRVSFTFLYVLPIGYATLNVGRVFAALLAGLSIIVWNGGDMLSASPSPGWDIRLWNDGIVFCVYAIVIYLVDALRRTLLSLEATVDSRTRALRLELRERERLEHEILDLTERERQTFGQELHDVVCQDLAGVAIAINLLAKKLSAKGLPESENAREVAGMVDQTLTKTRSVAGGYFTAGFNVEGLAAALAETARNAEERSGIRCELKWEENLVITNEDVVMHFFRIAQEAIQNAVKHSNASLIKVDLRRAPNCVKLTIEDNGKGITQSDDSGPGLGLRIMAYRAALIGAEFRTEKSDAEGIRVVCLIPLEKVHNQDAACLP